MRIISDVSKDKKLNTHCDRLADCSKLLINYLGLKCTERPAGRAYINDCITRFNEFGHLRLLHPSFVPIEDILLNYSKEEKTKNLNFQSREFLIEL